MLHFFGGRALYLTSLGWGDIINNRRARQADRHLYLYGFTMDKSPLNIRNLELNLYFVYIKSSSSIGIVGEISRGYFSRESGMDMCCIFHMYTCRLRSERPSTAIEMFPHVCSVCSILRGAHPAIRQGGTCSWKTSCTVRFSMSMGILELLNCSGRSHIPLENNEWLTSWNFVTFLGARSVVVESFQAL